MGVLSKWFKRSSPEQTQSSGKSSVVLEAKPAANSQSQPAPARDQAERLRRAVAAEQQTVRQERETAVDHAHIDHEQSDFESSADTSDDDAPLDASQSISRKPKSPRSKQELIEELHRNYQEVLGLIRKLDTHLDEAKDRSQTIADTASQYAKLAPVLESLPDRFDQRAGKLSEDIRSSISEEGAAARQLLERIESAIVHVGTDIERSTNQQGQLVQTMAEFRESLIDLSRSSTAACESVRDSEIRASDRDQALLSQLRQTRLWLIGLTVGVGAIGLTAVILGILALKG